MKLGRFDVMMGIFVILIIIYIWSLSIVQVATHL